MHPVKQLCSLSDLRLRLVDFGKTGEMDLRPWST